MEVGDRLPSRQGREGPGPVVWEVQSPHPREDPDDSQRAALLLKALDTALAVQQPAVARHVERIRAAQPDATPREVIEVLQQQLLRSVTVAGAAVGGTAAVPGVGTGMALTLSAGEVVAFLEAAALFTLAVAHVHGVEVEDAPRRRALVLAVLVGGVGREAVGGALGRTTGGPWGHLIAGNVSASTLATLNGLLKRQFIRRFATRQGALAVGRVLPFGIGAVVGGSGNRVLGHKVIRGAKEAFGPPPATHPPR